MVESDLEICRLVMCVCVLFSLDRFGLKEVEEEVFPISIIDQTLDEESLVKKCCDR